MKNKDFIEIAEKYGTPLYIFDTDEVVARASEIKRILNSLRENGKDGSENRIGLCYSIKANPFLIPALRKIVDKFEVCSPGELSICKHYQVPGEMIIYSGVHKELSDITEAIEYGASVLTVESKRHYDLISQAADRLDQEVEVILRLSAGSQFGMSPEDLEDILKTYTGSVSSDSVNSMDSDTSGSPHGKVTITGLHYFAGTGRTKLKHQKEELSELSSYLKKIRNMYSVPFPKLEYGPGLGFPYFEGEDFSDTLLPLKELLPALSDISSCCELTVEMGRFIASSCGYYLTRVVDTKRSFDRNWCILDGGINHVSYLGQMMGMRVPFVKHIRRESKLTCGVDTIPPRKDSQSVQGRLREESSEDGVTKENDWALCGSLCTTNDVLVRSVQMEDPNPDDLLVFCNIGAYSVTEAMFLFLSRDLPQVVLYTSENKAVSVRKPVESWKINC
ncbi:MAG: hypothetical protein IJT16_14205 [Lachnospiraceae bacterium]|nr:hypothetical protein [Lachnospiraceae bacterium]